MTCFKLFITQYGPDNWSATSKIIDDDGIEGTYLVGGSTLKELRDHVSEGVAGDLGISEISFEEVFVKFDWTAEEFATH